jgi:hypothetical protein
VPKPTTPTAPDSRVFYVYRDTADVNATDEDRAMAHRSCGTFVGYPAARAGLLAAIAAEFAEWVDSPYDEDWTSRLRLATMAVRFSAEPYATSVTVDGLRYWM